MSYLIQLAHQLIEEGLERLRKPPEFHEYTPEKDANILLNDLVKHPHAYVIACIMDQQMKSEKAWLIPYYLKQRLGFFDFESLAECAKDSPEDIEKAMLKPTPLHLFPKKMSKILLSAIHQIKTEYHGNAAEIWAGRPSSAKIVRCFLGFHGVGPKIATMAANILVRDFRIDVSDRYSLDISVDVHVKRVFARMGFVPENSTNEYLIYRAREIHPEYPGILDFTLWDVGRTACRPKQPVCEQCRYASLCDYANHRENP